MHAPYGFVRRRCAGVVKILCISCRKMYKTEKMREHFFLGGVPDEKSI